MDLTLNITDSRLARWWRGVWGALTNPATGTQLPAGGVVGGSRYRHMSATRASQIAAVFSCIRLIAETSAILPLILYRRVGEDGRERARKEPLYTILRERPNALMTALEFREAMTAQVVGWGNAYALVDRNSSGEIVALWPLSSDRMTVNRPTRGELVYYYYDPSEQTNSQGITRALAASNVFHIKGFGFDGVLGLSPLAHFRKVFGVAAAAEDFSERSFTTDARPAGILSFDKALSPKQFEDAKQNYKGLVEDDGNRLWVLDALAKYQPVSVSPLDMQTLAQREFQIAEIARIYRVPLFLLQQTTKETSWGSGIEQQNLAFLQYTLQPYLTRWEQAVDTRLLTIPQHTKLYAEHLVDALLRGDSKARADLYASAAQNGWMTRNEIRSRENLPEMDGADELTAQVNLAPLDRLGAPQPATPATREIPDATLAQLEAAHH